MQTIPQTIYTMPASAAAVTAASATDLVPNADFTFQPNFFQIGTKIKIRASGTMTTTTGSNTMTFAVQLGATVINGAFGAITLIPSQTTQRFILDIVVECRAVGAGTSTTFVATGEFKTATALLAVCVQPLPASGALTAGTGVDGTAIQKLSLYGTWSAVSNSITVEQYDVTLLAY